MRFLKILLFLIFILNVALYAQPGQETGPFVPQGILMGEQWNPETRELMVTYEDQDNLDLGEEGIRTVEFWADIRNAAGLELTWMIDYACGIQKEIYTQRIRYDRFRTNLSKTFRRKIWDAERRQLVDVAGECKIILVNKNNSEQIAVKIITIK
ncbi:hypothetical protein ACFL67_04555 [candidate division KSB1 bacterium]